MGDLRIQIGHSIAARGAALMGVLNVTPDSFYDGGRYERPEQAVERIDRLLGEGADIIDIGGESSRPGAAPVDAQEQIERLEPAVRFAVARGALVSVDTTQPGVAERMLTLGARLINDISCLADADLARVCARERASLILMHSRGPMQQMKGFSQYPDEAYADVVGEVLTEWRAARERAERAGLERSAIWLDPGLGFAKSARHSFSVLRELGRFSGEGVPVVLGASRKSFVAASDRSSPAERLGGSLAAALVGVSKGASVLRVHDVRETRQALAVARAIERGLPAEAAHA